MTIDDKNLMEEFFELLTEDVIKAALIRKHPSFAKGNLSEIKFYGDDYMMYTKDTVANILYVDLMAEWADDMEKDDVEDYERLDYVIQLMNSHGGIEVYLDRIADYIVENVPVSFKDPTREN